MNNKIEVNLEKPTILHQNVLVCVGNERTLQIYPDNVARMGFTPHSHYRMIFGATPIFNRWTPYSGDKAYFSDADMEILQPTFDFIFFQIESFVENGGFLLLPPEEDIFIPELIEKANNIAIYLRKQLDRIFDLDNTIKFGATK